MPTRTPVTAQWLRLIEKIGNEQRTVRFNVPTFAQARRIALSFYKMRKGLVAEDTKLLADMVTTEINELPTGSFELVFLHVDQTEGSLRIGRALDALDDEEPEG